MTISSQNQTDAWMFLSNFKKMDGKYRKFSLLLDNRVSWLETLLTLFPTIEVIFLMWAQEFLLKINE